MGRPCRGTSPAGVRARRDDRISRRQVTVPGSDELHHKELEILNMIYCQVVSAAELKAMMGL